MKKSFILTLVTIASSMANLTAQVGFTLDSLPSYGTGSNVSGFVVDWNTGASNEVIGWAYRWDEPTTMQEMIAGIAGTPGSNLFVRWDSDASGFGAFIFGLGYQNGATPFSVSGAVDDFGDPSTADFVNGIWDINVSTGFDAPFDFTGTASNVGDFYAEGFMWGSFVAGSAPNFSTSVSEQSLFSPSQWTATDFGISGVGLVNEGWYGLGNGRAPLTIPEPTSLLLLVAAGAMLVAFRRWLA